MLTYDSYAGNPNGVINRDLNWLLSDRDPRFATPTPDQMRGTTLERFKQVWEPLLAQGPVEVSIFGDFDREAALEALKRTFGALPPRQPLPAGVLARGLSFPDANAQPLVLRHRGSPDQAAAIIAWPTGGGSVGLPQSRKLDLLAEIFSNRMLDAMREKAGASYSPYVGSDWPLDLDSGGHILALAQLPPSQVPTFFSEADRIARELVETGPSQDELARVIEPMRQLLNRAQTGHSFWLSQLQGTSTDIYRLVNLRSLMSDYTSTTPLEMQALASRYFGPYSGFRIAILPEDPVGGAVPAGR
jgi:zinc protease